MQSRMEQRSSLVGAAVLALALCLGGCGDDEPQPTPDAGTNEVDSGTPDAGTDAGTVVDSDLAVVRLNSDGTVDTSFGAGGTSRLDLSTAAGGTRDTLWGMAVDGSGRPVLFGSQRGDGNRVPSSDRIDSDRVVVRLTAAGALDTTFGTNGVHTLNIGNLNDTPKHGIIDPDGKIVASGYTSQPTGVGSQSANRIVLARLDADGKLDNTFGWKGVVNSAPFGAQATSPEWGMVEAYAVGRQSDGSYVTTGYGRTASSGQVDVVSFRYSSTGQLDTTWGTNGVALLDLNSDNDRGRNLVVLGDDRVCTVGSGTRVAGNISAMVFMLDKGGDRDTSFAADGYKLYDFERTEQTFYGVAASPDGSWVAAAGYRAGSGQDDDAVLAFIPVKSGVGTEVAKAVPISETENDRFWAVAFDAQNRAYGAGFVTEGGDNRMVVARYRTNGDLDTTFGTGGIVKLNIVTGKLEEAVRGIAVLPDGKILVAGTVDK